MNITINFIPTVMACFFKDFTTAKRSLSGHFVNVKHKRT